MHGGTIGDALSGRPPVCIGPQASVREAAQLMTEHDCGSVLVMEGERLVGIFTERDLVKAVAGQGAASLQQSVSVAMTKNVIRCQHNSTTDQLMEIMTGGRFRHVPVEENGRLAGIISIGDVVKARIGEIEAEAEQIKAYIAG